MASLLIINCKSYYRQEENNKDCIKKCQDTLFLARKELAHKYHRLPKSITIAHQLARMLVAITLHNHRYIYFVIGVLQTI